MSEENIMTYKRGDELAFYANLTTDGTAPLVTSVDNIRCEIRTSSGKLVKEMSITATQNAGEYLFDAGDTNNWEIAKYEMDIEINFNGKPKSSDTIIIDLVKDITRPKVVE